MTAAPTLSPPPLADPVRAAWWGLRLGQAVFALVLLVGVPTFAILPLWSDSCLYDLCGQTILRGGTPYRDAFDTNLPGMPVLHALIRSALGWSSESLRLVDLGLFSVVLWMIARLLRQAGTPDLVRVWALVLVAGYYLSLPEINHCQRDGWMLAIALVGLQLRLNQFARLARGATAAATLGRGVLEGVCWGAAVWLKPFVVVPAACCWLLGHLRSRGPSAPGWGVRLADTLGLLLGGLLAGAVGVSLMIRAGWWEPFLEIQRGWNAEYGRFFTPRVRADVLYNWVSRFGPWAVLQVWPWVVVLVLAAERVWRTLWRKPAAGADTVPVLARRLLTAFAAGWFLQSLVVQVPHDYVLNSAVLVGVVALAGLSGPTYTPTEKAAGAVLVAWCLVPALAVLAGQTPLLEERIARGASDALSDRLTRLRAAGAVNWQDLGRVEDYLSTLGLRDGELLCFHDSTQPLYFRLGIAPGSRFFQFNIPIAIFKSKHEAIRQELDAGPHRYVVSDLLSLGKVGHVILDGQPPTDDKLPPGFPTEMKDVYPFCEPVLFRSGRYVVHQRRGPVARFWLPDAAPRSEALRLSWVYGGW